MKKKLITLVMYADLLDAVDKAASAKGVSRQSFIRGVLAKEAKARDDVWGQYRQWSECAKSGRERKAGGVIARRRRKGKRV